MSSSTPKSQDEAWATEIQKTRVGSLQKWFSNLFVQKRFIAILLALLIGIVMATVSFLVFPGGATAFVAFFGLTGLIGSIVPFLTLSVVGAVLGVSLLASLERGIGESKDRNATFMRSLAIVTTVLAGVGIGLLPAVMSPFLLNFALGLVGTELTYVLFALAGLVAIGLLALAVFGVGSFITGRTAAKPKPPISLQPARPRRSALPEIVLVPAPNSQPVTAATLGADSSMPASENRLPVESLDSKVSHRYDAGITVGSLYG